VSAVIGPGGSGEFPHISASGEFSCHRCDDDRAASLGCAASQWHEVDQPNKPLWGGARDRGKRAVAVEGSLLSRWTRIAKGELIGGGQRLHLNGQPLNHNVGISCFAEYAVVSRGSVVVIDRDVPLEDAALFGCAVITGVGAVVNTAKVPAGATMAVVGLGGVGLNAMLGGVVAEAGRLFAIDVNDSKLELARTLGATDTVNAGDPDCVAKVREATGGGVDDVFEMAGNIEAWKTAYAIVGRGGTLTSAGLTPAVAEFAFKPYDLVSDEKAMSYGQIWCMPMKSSGDLVLLFDLFSINEFHTCNDLCQVCEAA